MTVLFWKGLALVQSFNQNAAKYPKEVYLSARVSKITRICEFSGISKFDGKPDKSWRNCDDENDWHWATDIGLRKTGKSFDQATVVYDFPHVGRVFGTITDHLTPGYKNVGETVAIVVYAKRPASPENAVKLADWFDSPIVIFLLFATITVTIGFGSSQFVRLLRSVFRQSFSERKLG